MKLKEFVFTAIHAIIILILWYFVNKFINLLNLKPLADTILILFSIAFILITYVTMLVIYVDVRKLNKTYFKFSFIRYEGGTAWYLIVWYWLKWELLRVNMFFIHAGYYIREKEYYGFGRVDDPEPIYCDRCLWSGKRKHAIHTYHDDGTSQDVEPVDECPICGADI